MACGRGPRSSLRVLRHGLEVSEMAVSELPGNPNAVWTVKKRVDGQSLLCSIHSPVVIDLFQAKVVCILFIGVFFILPKAMWLIVLLWWHWVLDSLVTDQGIMIHTYVTQFFSVLELPNKALYSIICAPLNVTKTCRAYSTIINQLK